jgi:Domain of unknown function (DUF4282)
MSHPSDADRSAAPQPGHQIPTSSEQPWAQSGPGSPASGWSSASASDPAQSYGPSQPAPAYGADSSGYGAASPAYGAGSPGTGQQAPQDGGWAQAASKQGEAGFFRALFDFSFTHFITVKFSAFLYVVAILVALLMWLLQILFSLSFGALLGSASSGFYGESSFNAVPLILAIVFGWIPSVIALIAMRLGLEFSVATIRTAQNTTKIAEASAAAR